MEFKYINDKNKTPKSKPYMCSSNNSCDTLFKFLPNYSTPPSRFSKIVNPFERRLVDRLHLTTFSPSVFATVSTPKTDAKFKWTIDDISSLKPADIDEATISQHVFEEDPHVESLVQQKIDEFFSEKVIVPSPMVDIVRVPLVADTPENLLRLTETKEYCEGSTQTMLSLPPVLPAHIEELLKPYILPAEDRQNTDDIADLKNTSLYRNLFNFEKDTGCCSDQESHSSSSGKGYFPVTAPIHMDDNLRHSLPFEMSDLQDCSLSPIGRKSTPKISRSACRLDFSRSRMSLDASMVVPDICQDASNNSVLLESSQNIQQPEELSDSPVNWDMECRQVSFTSASSSPDSSKMDVSSSNTPHSKIFTGQRKRLSDSFKTEDDDFNKENEPHIVNDVIKQGRKLFTEDATDAGYHTISCYEASSLGSHMFASTPSKTKMPELF